HSILHAIGGVASIQNGIVNHRVLASRNDAVRILIDDEIQRFTRGMRTHLVPRGGSGNDSIEVLRVFLRCSQALPAALRATVVVRKLRRHSVVSTDESFGLNGHLVNRTI